jgi:hypothetical protein
VQPTLSESAVHATSREPKLTNKKKIHFTKRLDNTINQCCIKTDTFHVTVGQCCFNADSRNRKIVVTNGLDADGRIIDLFCVHSIVVGAVERGHRLPATFQHRYLLSFPHSGQGLTKIFRFSLGKIQTGEAGLPLYESHCTTSCTDSAWKVNIKVKKKKKPSP